MTFVKYERLGHGFFNNSDLDDSIIGDSSAETAGISGLRHSSTLKVFDLCEAFFRFYLVDRKRGFSTRDAESAE